MSGLPLVGIPADYRVLAGAGVHTADDLYIRAVVEAVGAAPVVLPALANTLDLSRILGSLDGILFTGSESNVAPTRYGGSSRAPGKIEDLQRDATNLPLIPAAAAAGLPLLAICRGFQETNVAYGGTLHQKLHELAGRLDHRAPSGQPTDMLYAPAHPVAFTEDGLLRRLLGADTGMVNSLHWQGVDRLGQGLIVEATAPDGTIEAVRVANASNFALAVQWHPEHRPLENPVSRAIFGAFREAVLKRAERRISKG